MGIREDALELADELEALERDGCEECIVYGQPECNGELPCAEAVAWHAARKIREAVERDGECATTVSAYDLLPDEDRKAIALVREHGGLGAVEKRLMPEGMEWPRFEDGEPVRIGDEVQAYDRWESSHVTSIKFTEDSCFVFYLWVGKKDGASVSGDHVKRPAPKVLDADGVEIREGDTVYVLGFGEPLTVKGFADDGRVLMSFHGENSLGYKPSKLTHEQPVLDADGVLCREGDEVWEVRSHRRREIVGTHYRDYETGEPLILCDGDDETPIPATCVTHTKPEPDSWERIEADCSKFCIEYCDEHGLLDSGCNAAEGDASTRHCTDCGYSCEERMVRDIVRRCRALVEKENRNE